MSKYLYAIQKLNIKSWIKYWLEKRATIESEIKLSDIITGTNFILNGTIQNPFKIFNIRGNTEQKTTTGKQLLDITENNRLTRCTYVSGAGTNQYKLLCTASDMYVNEIRGAGNSYSQAVCGNLIPVEYGETLYFDTGNSLFVSNYFTEFDENLVSLGWNGKQMSSGTYTPTNSDCKYITFKFGYGRNAVEGTTYTLAPIVCKTSDTSFEEYTGGQASPSTSYPQTLNSAGENGSINEEIVNENFIKLKDGTYTSGSTSVTVTNGILNFNGNDESVARNVYIPLENPVKLKKGQTFTFSISTTTIPNNKFSIRLLKTNLATTANSFGQTSSGIVSNKASITYTQEEDEVFTYVFLYMAASTSTPNSQAYYKLEPGSTATDYVEHQHQDISIPVQQEMRRVGSVRDEFKKINGIWYERHNIGYIASYNGETITTDYMSTTGSLTTGASVQYVLENPIDLLCTQEQITALEQIKNLTTYPEQTNIMSTDEVPANLEIQYYERRN